MDKPKFLISITIPTKNRQKYAEAAVRQIYCISDLIQIVICDNSDDDSLYNSIKDLVDNNRIKYYYTNHPIPVVENYSLAAEYADGEYLCAIGDDDGVLPNIIHLVQWMKENKIDAVKPSKNLSYVWPSNVSTGMLCVDKITNTIRPLDSEKAIIELLKNGGQGYLNLDLIGSYHCVVSMKMMHEVKKLTGHYYAGASPDMYSAVCLSLIKGYSCLYIDYPFTLPGVCPKSTTFDGKKGIDAGSVKTAPHFAGTSDYKWDMRIPYYYTSASIWAETMMHALSAMGKEKLIDEYFNEKVLINKMYWGNKNHRNEMMENFNSHQKSLIDYNFETRNRRFSRLRRILIVGFQWLRGNYYRKHGICDISCAVREVDNYLSKKSINLSV